MDPNILTQPTQSEIATQQPLPPKKSNKKIVFWVFAILLFLIAFVVGGFFTGSKQNISLNKKANPSVVQSAPTPTPDPTANWKTYKNEKYKFEFIYPQKYWVNDFTQKIPLKNLNRFLILAQTIFIASKIRVAHVVLLHQMLFKNKKSLLTRLKMEITLTAVLA